MDNQKKLKLILGERELLPGDRVYAIVNYDIYCDIIQKSLIQVIDGDNIRVMVEEKDGSHSSYVIPKIQCFESEEDAIKYLIKESDKFKQGDIYENELGHEYVISNTFSTICTAKGTGYGVEFYRKGGFSYDNNVIAFTRYKEILKTKVS